MNEQARRGFGTTHAVGAGVDLRIEVDFLAVELAPLRLVLAAQRLEAATYAADQVSVAGAHFVDPFVVTDRRLHLVQVAPAMAP